MTAIANTTQLYGGQDYLLPLELPSNAVLEECIAGDSSDIICDLNMVRAHFY